MGQARLRGTRDERVNAMLEVQREAQEQRDRDEMDELQATSRRWAAMTQEQRDAALEKAKAEARNYGQLQEIFGHDVAFALSGVMGR